MKSRFMLKPAGLCVVILLISFGFAAAEDTAGEFRPVDPNRIPEILTMISSRIKSNYDKIKTWQGEADAITDFIHEGAKAERILRERTNGTGEISKVVKEHFESRHQFAVDVEKDFLYSSLYRETPPAYTALENGRNLGTKSPRPWYTIVIIASEYSIFSMPHTYDRGNSIASCEAVKETRQKGLSCTSNMPPAFDREKLLRLLEERSGNHSPVYYNTLMNTVNIALAGMI